VGGQADSLVLRLLLILNGILVNVIPQCRSLKLQHNANFGRFPTNRVLFAIRSKRSLGLRLEGLNFFYSWIMLCKRIASSPIGIYSSLYPYALFRKLTPATDSPSILHALTSVLLVELF
jgi:hypothetical protein